MLAFLAEKIKYVATIEFVWFDKNTTGKVASRDGIVEANIKSVAMTTRLEI